MLQPLPQLRDILHLMERLLGKPPAEEALQGLEQKETPAAKVPVAAPVARQHQWEKPGAPASAAPAGGKADLSQAVRAFFAVAAWDGRVVAPPEATPAESNRSAGFASQTIGVMDPSEAFSTASVAAFFATAGWNGAAAAAPAPQTASSVQEPEEEPVSVGSKTDDFSAQNFFDEFSFD